jgi:hypothetical protein
MKELAQKMEELERKKKARRGLSAPEWKLNLK